MNTPTRNAGGKENREGAPIAQLISRLKEVPAIHGNVRAPYIDESFPLADVEYVLVLVGSSIEGTLSIRHTCAAPNEKETFVLDIIDGGTKIGTYNTGEPTCIVDRIVRASLAAADRWDLLPDEAMSEKQRMAARSKEGSGATVPNALVQQTGEALRDASEPERPFEAAELPDITQIRFGFIEDDPRAPGMVSEKLAEYLGMTRNVGSATNLQDAMPFLIRAAQEGNVPHILFLDQSFPKVPGGAEHSGGARFFAEQLKIMEGVHDPVIRDAMNGIKVVYFSSMPDKDVLKRLERILPGRVIGSIPKSLFNGLDSMPAKLKELLEGAGVVKKSNNE